MQAEDLRPEYLLKFVHVPNVLFFNRLQSRGIKKTLYPPIQSWQLLSNKLLSA